MTGRDPTKQGLAWAMNNAFLLPLVFALAQTAIRSEPADAVQAPHSRIARIESVYTVFIGFYVTGDKRYRSHCECQHASDKE